MERPAALSRFIHAFDICTQGRLANGHPAKGISQRMCSALHGPGGVPGDGLHHTLAACRYFDAALANARAGPPMLPEMADAFQALDELLAWRTSTRPGTRVFNQGHANTQIVGPEGIERRSDVILGASLLAPEVTYPLHDHPPEEIYLVMSEGDWFRSGKGWYTPGIGGIVHHPCDVTHAMRAGAAPLLAVWCLWTGQP